jgi:hypothetical protein
MGTILNTVKETYKILNPPGDDSQSLSNIKEELSLKLSH